MPQTEGSVHFSRVSLCPADQSNEITSITSTLSTIIATQPSFKKFFMSSKHFLSNYKSSLKPSRLLNSPRWSRKKSSTQLEQVPTTIQINAGRRIVKKYRRFARNLEYNRLRSIIPSLSKRKYASKVKLHIFMLLFYLRSMLYKYIFLYMALMAVKIHHFHCRLEYFMKQLNTLTHYISNLSHQSRLKAFRQFYKT